MRCSATSQNFVSSMWLNISKDIRNNTFKRYLFLRDSHSLYVRSLSDISVKVTIIYIVIKSLLECVVSQKCNRYGLFGRKSLGILPNNGSYLKFVWQTKRSAYRNSVKWPILSSDNLPNGILKYDPQYPHPNILKKIKCRDLTLFLGFLENLPNWDVRLSFTTQRLLIITPLDPGKVSQRG